MKKHYHLIGIGGAGMSAIAQILHDRGETVSGSDRSASEVTERLAACGIQISIGHDAGNVDGADVVVYSAAIPETNPERVRAVDLGLRCIERPIMLGKLMEPYIRRIAVCGTHGKTTTTSMIASIFERAEIPATSLIGGDVKSLGGNAKLGDGSVILTEACEAFGSFLYLHPSMAVVTNVEADHLDYYGTAEKVEETFTSFLGNVDPDGCVIACWDDKRTRSVCEDCGRRLVTYGMEGRLDVLAERCDLSTPHPVYQLVFRGKHLGQIRLAVPGAHNVLNSLAAAAVALEMVIPFEDIQSALSQFTGAGRRFEVLFDSRDIMVVDDYAHHPTEIKATLTAIRKAYRKRLVAVFQPHLYSRTKFFLTEFAQALSIADEVIVNSIYAAREEPIPGITGESVVNLMKFQDFENVHYMPDKAEIVSYLAGSLKAGDIAVILGAGDIRTVSEDLADAMKQSIRSD